MTSISQSKKLDSANLSAIVLAGGRSSRMGQDKALISIGENTLLQQVCSVAQQCVSAVYVVTPWVERYQTLLNDLQNPPIHFVQEQRLAEDDNDILHGPLVGFAQGLTQVKTDWVLLLACDLPNLQAEVLQTWSTLLPDADKATIAFLPQNSNGWWEPLCGFYRQRCLTKLEPFIAAGGRSFQRWLSQESVQVLPLPEPQLLFNCNTPEDLEKVKAQG